MHAVIGATEEHNLAKLLRCFCMYNLAQNETMLVVDIIKPVTVSRLLFKNQKTKLYGLCVDGWM